MRSIKSTNVIPGHRLIGWLDGLLYRWRISAHACDRETQFQTLRLIQELSTAMHVGMRHRVEELKPGHLTSSASRGCEIKV